MNEHLIEPIDALLFDMDGTLVETTEAVERCWRAWAAHYEVDIRRILEICHGRQARTTIKAVAPHLNLEEAVQNLLQRELDEKGGVKQVAGAAEFLQALEGRPWTVVTSAARPLALHRLGLAGLPVPDNMVTAEDVEHGKPDPACFLLGAQKLGAAPLRTLVLEDSLAGLEAGRRAGMQTLQICASHPPHDPASPLRARDYRRAAIKEVTKDAKRWPDSFAVEVYRLG
jgi:sugar-phosphatase